MVIARLQSLVSEEFETVNAVISQSIQSNISVADNLSHYIIQSGGKRIRPMLFLLMSRACGYEGNHHINGAAMIEFFHTATLLQDDVIDESPLRRGKKTANRIWGNKASILVADLFFTQYMQLMVTIGDLNIMKILTNMAYQVGCGELMQLSNRHNLKTSTEDYYKIIRAKTSLLFSTSGQIAAIISQLPLNIQENMARFGEHLGNAFQLIDDALDYCADPEVNGKTIGNDFADGKVTMPLICALEKANEEQNAIIRQAFETGNLQDILKIIQETEAIESTKAIAQDEITKAIAALDCLPDSVYKEALVDLAHYMVGRDH